MITLIVIVALLWIVAAVLWLLEAGATTQLAVNVALADESPVNVHDDLQAVA